MGVGSVARVNAASFGSRLYLAQLARAQERFAARLRAEVPGVAIERRYRVVLDALAVRVPAARSRSRRADAGRRRRLPGRDLPPADGHRPGPRRRRPAVGRRPLDRGRGHQGRSDRRRHRRGRAVPRARRPARPRGLPARAAALHERPRDRRAQLRRGRRARCRITSPFDPTVSEHGTHVSGIIAGAYGTVARPGLGLPVVRGLSGVAPGAWLGNYRGLARGDHESGAIGSTVELAAAVDAAVADGMDVLNLSLGGPQIDPSADALAMALANAARAGIPSVVAAGNDFDSRGYGSVSSPGTTATAITVAATSSTRVFGVNGRVSGSGYPELAPFTAVPSIGPRVPAALGSPTRLVLAPAYGLDRRGCREPSRRHALRAVVIAAARRLQLRHQGDQRARRGGRGGDRRERPARAAVRRRGGGGAAAARRDRRRRQPTCTPTSRAPAATRACASRA